MKGNTTVARTGKSGVAFPQPSVVSNKHIKIGTSLSSGFFGLLIAVSVRPNLWLAGSVLGVYYGSDLAEKAVVIKETYRPTVSIDGVVSPSPQPAVPGGLYGKLLLKLGKKIASKYLKG